MPAAPSRYCEGSAVRGLEFGRGLRVRTVVMLVAAVTVGVLFAPQVHAAQPRAAQAKEEPRGRPSLYGQIAIELLELPEARLRIGEAALRLSTLIMTGERYDRELALLDEIANQVAKVIRLKGRDDPEFRVEAISTVLHALGFHFSFNDMEGTNPENSLLLSILRTRAGNCVAMPILWYAVAERLGYPVYAVQAPQHLFLRYDDGRFRQNIETTTATTASDERIISDLEIPAAAVKSGAFMRSLSKREFLAVLIADVAEKLSRTRNPGLAIELLEDARTVLPNSIAIHWNLALGYNDTSFMRLARQGSALQVTGARPAVPDEAKLAIEHALAATKLGAPKPLAKEYWTHVSRLGEKATGAAKPAPEPFDVTSLIMREDAQIKLTWTWAVDPVLYQDASEDPSSCARFCTRFCGPAPGNLCAEDYRRRGLMR